MVIAAQHHNEREVPDPDLGKTPFPVVCLDGYVPHT